MVSTTCDFGCGTERWSPGWVVVYGTLLGPEGVDTDQGLRALVFTSRASGASGLPAFGSGMWVCGMWVSACDHTSPIVFGVVIV